MCELEIRTINQEAQRWEYNFGGAYEAISHWLSDAHKIPEEKKVFIGAFETFFNDAITGKKWITDPASLLPKVGVKTSTTYLLAKSLCEEAKLGNDVEKVYNEHKGLLDKMKRDDKPNKEDIFKSLDMLKIIYILLRDTF